MNTKCYNQTSQNVKNPYAQMFGLQNVFVPATASNADLASVKEIAREDIQVTTYTMNITPVGNVYLATQAEQQLAKAKKRHKVRLQEPARMWRP